MYQKLTGIVISSTNYGDSDRLVNLFSKEEGIVTGIGKGARKITSKRLASLNTLNLIKVNSYVKNEYFYLNESKLIEEFKNIKASVVLTGWALFLLESLQNTTPKNEPNISLYNLTLKALKDLNSKPSKRVVYRYLVTLVKMSGFWDPSYTKKFPQLNLIETNESVDKNQQVKIDSFFVDLLVKVSDRPINSTMFLKNLY